MTATQPRPRLQQRAASKGRHPTSKVRSDGRGPRRPIGRRTPLFLVLFIAVVGLVLLGMVMVLSASAAVSISESDSAWSLFRRQLIWVGIGFVVLLVTMRIDYHKWKILALPSIAASMVLLGLVVIPGVGITANGATRWLSVGPLSFQPSEIAKLGLVLFIAELLARPSRPMENTRITVRPVVVVTGLMVLALAAQPHLGAILVIGSIAVFMMFMAGAPMVHLTGLVAGGGMVAFSMVMSTSWRRARFFAFRDPWSDPTAAGYQALQSLHAITVGGVTGVGLGASRAKWGFLPFAHTDFIFAIIAEELGLIGAAVVILGFVAIGVSGFMAALRAPDRYGMLLGVGIISWIVVQAILNLGAVMSLLPVTGVTLPFLSFGGTSLVVTMAAVGVVLNIARQGR